MGSMITVTGGARSGKSALAEQLVAKAGENVLYIATARAFDDEMRDRIAHHQASRPSMWRTYEGCYDIAAQISAHDGPVLLDCMTIFVTNRMMDRCEDWDNAPLDLAAELEQELLHESVRRITVSNGAVTVLLKNNQTLEGGKGT